MKQWSIIRIWSLREYYDKRVKNVMDLLRGQRLA